MLLARGHYDQVIEEKDDCTCIRTAWLVRECDQTNQQLISCHTAEQVETALSGLRDFGSWIIASNESHHCLTNEAGNTAQRRFVSHHIFIIDAQIQG